MFVLAFALTTNPGAGRMAAEFVVYPLTVVPTVFPVLLADHCAGAELLLMFVSLSVQAISICGNVELVPAAVVTTE